MKKIYRLIASRAALVALMLLCCVMVSSAVTRKYSGKVQTYPIIVELDFADDNSITGRYAFTAQLKKDSDNENAWLNIKSTSLRYTPGIIAKRFWECEITDRKGKIIERWTIEDSPNNSSNLEVTAIRPNGWEYKISLKPKR